MPVLTQLASVFQLVRYTGMGDAHLSHIRDHMPPGSQAFDMNGDDFDRFRRETDHSKQLAGEPVEPGKPDKA